MNLHCAAFLVITIVTQISSTWSEISGFVRAIPSTIENEHPSVTRFREYLRIETDHPDPDYESAISWLKIQADEIGLEFYRIDFQRPDLFAIWLTWRGRDPRLQSILLNSHMDVVAVDRSKWTHDPFGAFKDGNGNIVGRGAVDMKSGTMGALEAIRNLKSSGFVPLRTIHVSILPDEEVGGNHGMKPFLESAEFKNLNVGFDMDEAAISPDDEMLIEYAQKSIWQFNFTARGESAHGSNLPEVTSGDKLRVVIDKLMDYRASQVELMNEPGMGISNVTSLNLVRTGGGLGNNIIPDELWASFDMRIRIVPGWNFTDVEKFLDEIVDAAGPGVSYTFIQKSMATGITEPVDSNIWWATLQEGCAEMNLTCLPLFENGGTDARHVRNHGIPAFGVNGFINSPKLAHQDNEYINEQTFLEGITHYETFIKGVSTVSGDLHP